MNEDAVRDSPQDKSAFDDDEEDHKPLLAPQVAEEAKIDLFAAKQQQLKELGEPGASNGQGVEKSKKRTLSDAMEEMRGEQTEQTVLTEPQQTQPQQPTPPQPTEPVLSAEEAQRKTDELIQKLLAEEEGQQMNYSEGQTAAVSQPQPAQTATQNDGRLLQTSVDTKPVTEEQRKFYDEIMQAQLLQEFADAKRKGDMQRKQVAVQEDALTQLMALQEIQRKKDELERSNNSATQRSNTASDATAQPQQPVLNAYEQARNAALRQNINSMIPERQPPTTQVTEATTAEEEQAPEEVQQPSTTQAKIMQGVKSMFQKTKKQFDEGAKKIDQYLAMLDGEEFKNGAVARDQRNGLIPQSQIEADQELARAIAASLAGDTLTEEEKALIQVASLNVEGNIKEQKEMLAQLKRNAQKKREEDGYEEIVFDDANAAQIHPGLFKVHVHRLSQEGAQDEEEALAQGEVVNESGEQVAPQIQESDESSFQEVTMPDENPYSNNPQLTNNQPAPVPTNEGHVENIYEQVRKRDEEIQKENSFQNKIKKQSEGFLKSTNKFWSKIGI